MAIPCHLWPRFQCDEMGGEAWHAAVVSSTQRTALVSFTRAKTRDGRRYEDIRLPLTSIRSIV